MADAAKKDVWASGDAYELYVGRWSRLVARDFLDWIKAPAGKRWLDVGCGTGALSQTILEKGAPSSVHGVDPSDGFLELARRRLTHPRARFEKGDAQALPLPDGAADVAVSGLVLNFVPDQAKAAAELRRVLAAGGVAAAYVWDYTGEMQMMRRFWDAAVALDPAAREKDEGPRFPLCRPDAFTALFRNAGFRDVTLRAIDAPTVFRDFDDYWTPFLGGNGPAPAYCISLNEDRRAALRERLRSTLPAAPDGKISLIARAFAVRGVK